MGRDGVGLRGAELGGEAWRERGPPGPGVGGGLCSMPGLGEAVGEVAQLEEWAAWGRVAKVCGEGF